MSDEQKLNGDPERGKPIEVRNIDGETRLLYATGKRVRDNVAGAIYNDRSVSGDLFGMVLAHRRRYIGDEKWKT